MSAKSLDDVSAGEETGFQKLLSLLSADSQKAIAEYYNLQRGLEAFFRLKGISFPDNAARLAVERTVAIIEKNEYDRIEDIRNVTFGVAKKVLLELYKSERREAEVKSRLSSQKTNNFNPSERNSELMDAQKQCLEKLPDEEKELIVKYYSAALSALSAKELKHSRERLAEDHGMEINSLRTKVFRIRHKLEKCLNGERLK